MCSRQVITGRFKCIFLLTRKSNLNVEINKQITIRKLEPKTYHRLFNYLLESYFKRTSLLNNCVDNQWICFALFTMLLPSSLLFLVCRKDKKTFKPKGFIYLNFFSLYVNLISFTCNAYYRFVFSDELEFIVNFYFFVRLSMSLTIPTFHFVCLLMISGHLS